jgi:hypothetical protein
MKAYMTHFTKKTCISVIGSFISSSIGIITTLTTMATKYNFIFFLSTILSFGVPEVANFGNRSPRIFHVSSLVDLTLERLNFF